MSHQASAAVATDKPKKGLTSIDYTLIGIGVLVLIASIFIWLGTKPESSSGSSYTQQIDEKPATRNIEQKNVSPSITNNAGQYSVDDATAGSGVWIVKVPAEGAYFYLKNRHLFESNGYFTITGSDKVGRTFHGIRYTDGVEAPGSVLYIRPNDPTETAFTFTTIK